MRPAPHRSVLPMLLLLLGLLFVGGVGVFATLVLMGVVELFKRVPQPNYEGMVLVPRSVKEIPAYTRVTRDHLRDPATGEPKVVPYRPEQVKPNLFVDESKILGRVLARDKPAGYVFKEEDFLPEGTRAGLVGGVPPGKRALDIEAEKIHGIHSLHAGDHFDLVTSLPLEDKRPTSGGTYLSPGLQPGPQPKRTLVKVLVQNGVVVLPVTTRQVPIANPTRRGGPAQTRPVEQVVIALEPQEIAPLTEALALGGGITCVARSGRPDDPGASSRTPGSSPPKRRVIEVITGNKRQQLVYPTVAGEPDIADNPAENEAPPKADTTTRDTPDR